MTNTRKMEPPNKIFSNAMVARIREFVAENHPTNTATLAEMLLAEFATRFTPRQVGQLLTRQRLTVIKPSLSPVRGNPALMQRIREMIEIDPGLATGEAIAWMIKQEFGIAATNGQIAGAIATAGLSGIRSAAKAQERAARPQATKPPETPQTPPAVVTAAPSYRDEAEAQARKREEMLRELLRR